MEEEQGVETHLTIDQIIFELFDKYIFELYDAAVRISTTEFQKLKWFQSLP